MSRAAIITTNRGGIKTLSDALTPAGIPGVPAGKRSKKIKSLVCGDGSTVFACSDCTYVAVSFNSVAAHRKVHVTAARNATAFPAPASSIEGTHLEKILVQEITSVVEKVTFADKSELRRLNRELARTKKILSDERAARRKAERALKRIKAAI